MNNTPPINSFGLFRLKSPWSLPLVPYKCISIDSLLDVGGYEKHYGVMGLSNDTFIVDSNNGINLITLVDNNGNTVMVPSSYIEHYPSDVYVSYSRLVLSVDLGELPDTIDLSGLRNQIEDLCKTLITSKASLAEHRLPLTKIVSYKESEQRELNRADELDNVLTIHASKIKTELELSECLEKIRLLEEVLEIQSAIINPP